MGYMLKQCLVLATLLVVAFTNAPEAYAADEIYTGTFSNNAVSGYDAVAYFSQQKAVRGSEQFTTDYKGATWLFSSQENRDAFVKNPDKYAPQYGGHCAYAVAKNDLVSADPEAWKIVDGKLYLNYDHDIQKEWEMKQAEYVSKADANWPELNK